jgi:Ca2+-binding RTX toxin-like protein
LHVIEGAIGRCDGSRTFTPLGPTLRDVWKKLDRTSRIVVGTGERNIVLVEDVPHPYGEDLRRCGAGGHLSKGNFVFSRSSVRRASIAAAASSALLLPVLFPITTANAAEPTCFGQTVTIMGTSGPDDLLGEPDVSDVIYGGGGDDVIFGAMDWTGPDEAPDLLCGGPGDDYVKGATGDDRLKGGDGDDVVNGSLGADVEKGNAGNDRIGEGSYEDADSADDVMRGGPGADYLLAGEGRDRMFGQSGADRLVDQECDGPTVLSGGNGRDYLESFESSLGGGTVCDSLADRVIGAGDIDTAKVDRLDRVNTVEHITRVR